MPPRRSARVAAAEERALSMLAPLPPALVRVILALLPRDARARAACVNRAWRAAADASDAWATLDLRPFVALAPDAYRKLLRGAAAKARGRLQSLDVRGCRRRWVLAALGPIVAANGGTLRELYVDERLSNDDVAQLLASAPALRELHANVDVDSAEAAALLAEPRLRLRELVVDLEEPPRAVLAPLLRRSTTLKRLELVQAPANDAAALSELLDAAAAARVPSLKLYDCELRTDAFLALAALLRGGALATLTVADSAAPLAAPVCAALRSCTTLTTLRLIDVGLFHVVDAGVALLAAVTGHATIRRLHLRFNLFDEGAAGDAVGTALGALLAANAPSLTDLNLDHTVGHERAAVPLLRALRANTHLRCLSLWGNAFGDAFVNGKLRDAVHANTALVCLRLGIGLHTSWRAAEELVVRRAEARGDAPFEEFDEWE